MLCNENCQIELITYQHVVRRNSVVYRVKERHKDLIVYMRREEMHINQEVASGAVQKINPLEENEKPQEMQNTDWR